MRAAGGMCSAATFIPEGTDSQCAKCCEWGHTEFRCNRNRVFCGLYAEDHTTAKHTCPVKDCKASQGRACQHIILRCAACKVDGHPTNAFACPSRKAAKAAARGLQANQEEQTVDPAPTTNPST